jgi:hypothetical protein
MTDVFERPTIHVSQTLRPRIATTPRIHHAPDDRERVRQIAGSSATTSRAALAALRQAHRAEGASAIASIAGQFNSRRVSALGQIDAEYAYKIAAAVMFGTADMQHSAVAALRQEQRAKAAAMTYQIAGEERAARQAMLSNMRSRHAAERKAVQSSNAPVRPTGRSSTRFAALKSHDKI